MTGPGSFNWQAVGAMGSDWTVAQVGDFSGDGQSDILWRNVKGAASVWTAAPNGTFSSHDLGWGTDPTWRVAA
jgi:hypothetical protein